MNTHMDDLLNAAVRDLQQGRLAPAEDRLRQVLAREPRNAEALHMLGVCLHGAGRFAQAEAAIAAALQVDPACAPAHVNRGNALRALNRLGEALASFRRACELDPDLVVARFSRAWALFEMQRPAEALAQADELLRRGAGSADLHCLRGYCHQQLGRNEEALRAYEQAIGLDASNLGAHRNRASLLLFLGRPADAVAAYDRMLAADPGNADARSGRGQALFAQGVDLLRQSRFAEAARCLESYLQEQPADARAWNNLGLALKGLGRLDPAVDAFQRAVACAPAFDLAHSNLANVLVQLARHADARASYERALAIEPGNALTRWNLGLCRLSLGEWPGGWEDYEARWSRRDTPLFAPREFFGRPRWHGAEDPAGRTIFLHAEQGLGDTLQFCRYARELAQRGARVVLEVPPPLHALVARSFAPGISVIAKGQAIPAFDFHSPLLSLPLAFGTTQETVPAGAPYLSVCGERREKWQAQLGPRARPRIGVVWSSGISNPQRDIPLAMLRALDDGRWDTIGLQTELRDSDRAALESFARLRWVGRDVSDFEDTAALVALCDLVISVDTSVAHLAGALGKDVWILLPFAPDWRWLLDRDDSPWYPSAQLFRQRVPGSWAGVVDEIATELSRTVLA
jgi:tetratricopeptide (TPR) repeat protein